MAESEDISEKEVQPSSPQAGASPQDSFEAERLEIPTVVAHLQDKATLYAAYMPFVKGGGVFLSGQKNLKQGDTLNLQIKLMDDPTWFTVKASVVWLTPMGAQGGRSPGAGVQFIDEAGKALRNKIETYLAGALQSERRTESL